MHFFGNKSFIAKTAPYFQGPVRVALGLAVIQHLFYFQFFEIKPMFSHVSFVVFAEKSKEPHIKKPLNAFMLYMKEMRPVVQAECTLKESAAINQILGRRVIISNDI